MSEERNPATTSVSCSVGASKQSLLTVGAVADATTLPAIERTLGGGKKLRRLRIEGLRRPKFKLAPSFAANVAGVLAHGRPSRPSDRPAAIAFRLQAEIMALEARPR